MVLGGAVSGRFKSIKWPQLSHRPTVNTSNWTRKTRWNMDGSAVWWRLPGSPSTCEWACISSRPSQLTSARTRLDSNVLRRVCNALWRLHEVRDASSTRGRAQSPTVYELQHTYFAAAYLGHSLGERYSFPTFSPAFLPSIISMGPGILAYAWNSTTTFLE